VILNGASADSPVGRELLGEFAEIVPHRLLALPAPALDLGAYLQAAALLEHERICFLNSYAAPLADGWLAALAGALEEEGVGIAGATGSWESQAEWRRGSLRHRPRQLAALHDRSAYPRFPNPHLRTSSFVIARGLLLELALEQPADKREAYLLESGRASITARIQQRGLRAVVVGRDGRSYDTEDWPASNTFRSGGQENLLVADNQTRDYRDASPRRRRRLARDSWGSAAYASSAATGRG